MDADYKPRLFAPRLATSSLNQLLQLISNTPPDQLPQALKSAGDCMQGDSIEAQSYKACCYVLADLVDQEWDLRLQGNGVHLLPPAPYRLRGESVQDAKLRLRRGLLVGRDRQLSEPSVRAFLSKMETPRRYRDRTVSVKDLIEDGLVFGALLADAAGLAEGDRLERLKSLISPVLEVCSPGRKCPHTGLELQDIWRYFRHTWSLEYRPTPGRTLQVLIRNQARPNAPIMGIAMLASACTRLRIRDEWIGWTTEALASKVETGEWDSGRVAQMLLAAIDQGLGEVRADDLLTEAELQDPSLEVLHRLRKAAQDAEKQRLQALADDEGVHDGVRDSSTNVDWLEASDRPLFKKKRAATLAAILTAKMRFIEAGIAQDAEHGLSALLSTGRGRSAIEAALTEVRKRRLASSLLDVSICGAIPPYNHILTGKLVALLLGSAEMQEEYTGRYAGKVSVIASQMAGRPITRSPEILLLTTTSLYGVGSSQYNRLAVRTRSEQHASSVKWIELGKTTGFGTAHLSKKTVETLRELSRLVHGVRRINNVFGEGTSPRLRQIREGLDILGMKGDGVLQHSTPRIVYACECVPGSAGQLLGWSSNEVTQRPSVAEIADAWLRRWVVNRITRPQVVNAISVMEPSSGSYSEGGDELTRQRSLTMRS